MTTEPLASTATTADDIAADTLTGAAEIAAFIGKPVRRVNHMLKSRQLPAFKLGKLWHMRRSAYRRMVETREAAAVNAMQTAA